MTDAEARTILLATRTIAVVGLSRKPWRASYGVSEYMQSEGYRVIPVNPHEGEVLGEQAYPSLADVPVRLEMVNIFRRSELVPELVEAAIAIGAHCVWMQEGVMHEAAAAQARAASLAVVMDRCLLKEHQRLLRAIRP